MNNYRLNITMEPLNKYEKAKQDLIQAKISIQSLNSAEQERLAKEVFGVVDIFAFKQALSLYLNTHEK